MPSGIDLDCGGEHTMGKNADRAELLADRLELPADALGALKLSLCGRNRLLVENHRGIIAYGESVIEIDCGVSKLVVMGDELRLAAMDKHDMLICGKILSLEFE